MVSTVRRQVDQHLKGCVPSLLFFNLVEVQADANAMGDLRSLTDYLQPLNGHSAYLPFVSSARAELSPTSALP